MKKVLVITYYWPPSGGAGVQRWLKFIKYLRENGWEPVVYTPENPEYPEIDNSLLADIPSGLTVIRTRIREPYGAYKKVIGRKKEERINASFLSEKKRSPLLENISVWVRGNFFIPDARMLWIRPSVRFLAGYLEKNPVDAFVSTGPPHSMHLIALKLHERTGLPWLADFRDPWTDIDFYQELKLTPSADRKHRRLEKKVLSEASSVTVISPVMAESFGKTVNRNYEVITNGFDSEDSAKGEPPVDQKFSISHIGTMVSSRNPLAFWEAVRSILNENEEFAKDLVIKLVGKTDFRVTESIAKYGLEKYVERVSYLPHNEVVRIQQVSQVLLLVINETPNARMILTGKFFEYLAAKRPILCLGPVDGDAARILEETGSGAISGFGDSAGMKRNLLAFYNGFKQGKPASVARGIEKYSRKALTARLAVLLDSLAR
jgi:glycosyltransferase involved in cell wall biosynthesis